MEIASWAAVAAVLFLILVLVAARRQRHQRRVRNSPDQAHAPIAPVHAAPTSNAWMFDGGGGGY